jgi:peptidoglycan hydrolase CwlO-like protein
MVGGSLDRGKVSGTDSSHPGSSGESVRRQAHFAGGVRDRGEFAGAMRFRSLQLTCVVLGVLALLVQAAGPPSSAAPTEAEVDAAEERLEELRGDLGSVQSRLGDTRARLTEVRNRIATTTQDVEEIAKRILRRKEGLVKVAQELYKSGASGSLEVLMSAESLSELEERAEYLKSSGQVHLEELEQLANDRALLLTKLDDLDAARSEVSDMLAQVRELQASLQTKVSDQAGEVASLQEELEAQRLEEALAAEEQAQELEQELEDIAEPPPPPAPSGDVDWDAIAECESGGNWSLDSTYDGGLQFHPDTWLGYGGGAYARYAWQATREQQIAIAERVLDGQGPGAWPNCFQYG